MTDGGSTEALIVDDITAFGALLPQSGRLLGLDLGTKTIGVARSDTARTIASSVETLRRKKFKLDGQRLMQLAEEGEIVAIVIGLPLNLNGTAGPRVQATKAFARNLMGILERPILLWDERLSTVAAERALLEADTSRAKRRKVIDQVAATLILQSALDALRRPSDRTQA